MQQDVEGVQRRLHIKGNQAGEEHQNRGHQAGDKVLAGIARTLGTNLRPNDLACRYGGEEFVLVLPGADSGSAAVVAERLRQRVGESVYDTGLGASLRATISAGYASLPIEEAVTPEALLASADAALYAAKRSGRNCVVAARPPSLAEVDPSRSSVPVGRGVKRS